MTTIVSDNQTNSPKDNYVLNIFLVDKTGSMTPHRKTTVSGFQEFKDGLNQKKDPNINVKYALGLFDTTCEISEYESLDDMPELVLIENYEPDNKKHLLYNPGNMTALYDALDVIFKKWGHINNCVLAIFTDGESNSDYITTKLETFKKIRKLEKENEWMFHYFGANIDAYQGGSDIGISNITQCDCDDMPSVFRNISSSMATMTRAQSNRQSSAPPVLQTPETLKVSNINSRPLTQEEIDMLAPPLGLTRQVAQVFDFDDDGEYASEFDLGRGFNQADV